MRLPTRFLGMVTKGQLAEMLAPSYAKAKNVDPNEAYRRLEAALKNVRFIARVQEAVWGQLVEKRPQLDDEGLLALLEKKQAGSKRYKAAPSKRADQGALSAFFVAVDVESGFGGGEAASLLETEMGEKLLAAGHRLMGAHLADELLR